MSLTPQIKRYIDARIRDAGTGVEATVPDGDKGDITVSSSGTIWTIDNGVVSTAKMGGDVTTAGKALLDDADAAAQRTTLGLGTLATQSTVNVSTQATGVLPYANGGTNSSTVPTANSGDYVLVYDSSTGVAKVINVSGTGSTQFLKYNGGDVLFDTPPNFTSGAAGYAPASGGGTTNFLRADGSWAAPTISSISANNVTAGTFPGATYTFTDEVKATDLTVDTNLLVTDSTNNRIGINQATPLYSLDVTGTARITGTTTLNSQTYTWPSSQAANYYLQTNGSGTLSWAAVSGLTDGDKGDITVSSSGATWTIDTGAVTLGKIQQIAATRVLGNASAITNNVSELSLTNVLDMVGSATHGDILFRGASSWSRLPAGTSGNVLQTNGSGADPSWVSAGGSDPWTYTKLTSDFITANSTLTDITGLTFTPASSTMYEFEAVLMIRTGTATNNPRTGLAWPTAGVTDGVAFIQQTGSATTTLVYQSGNSAATIQIPVGGLPGASASYPVFIKGVLNMTTGASGTLKLQMAAETAGTSMTVRAGSFFKYRSF